MNVILCRPPQFPLRRRAACPTCATVTRFAGYDQVWYGVTWWCCACGDGWSDGERLARPFRRGWRKQSVENAQRIWAEAGKFTKAQHRAWFEAEVAP